MQRFLLRPATLALALLAAPALAQQQDFSDAPCGGDWGGFLDALVAEAVAAGIPEDAARQVVAGAREDPSVIQRDRAKGTFQADFLTFSQRLINQDRVDRAARNADALAGLFERIEAETGVPRGILLAFWAFETDFGQVQGDFDTTDALLTLAHDCRRPALFRPQVLAAMRLAALGEWDADVTGAWAGEIGQVQMLPADILAHAADGDGDGVIDLKGSSADALVSASRKLQAVGWRAGEPWLQEVTVPAGMDWSATGLDRPRPAADWVAQGVAPREGAIREDLPAALVLPVGRRGPAFLAYPNFTLLAEWNQSLTYLLTAGYFATRIEGGLRYAVGDPEPGLDGDAMMALQERLAARGHDVGEIDGILGAGTRAAVREEQMRLGLPADGWPTPALLDAL